jgi:hypothetical protein
MQLEFSVLGWREAPEGPAGGLDAGARAVLLQLAAAGELHSFGVTAVRDGTAAWAEVAARTCPRPALWSGGAPCSGRGTCRDGACACVGEGFGAYCQKSAWLPPAGCAPTPPVLTGHVSSLLPY